MLLSIIVPVFNVETYLKKCVDSLLDQDLARADYEIILIDDGSTDTSGQICDFYASSIENIHVIHQRNRGLSNARNTGISAAKGQYIQFVDSDDYLNADVLGEIIQQLKSKNLDILRINYQNVNVSGRVFEPNKHSKPFVDYDENVCDGLTFLTDRLGFACYAVQFVVKTSLIRQAGNGFKEGVYFEDVEWTPRILLQANRVASCRTMVYNYSYRSNSITRNSDLSKRKKALVDKVNLIQALIQQQNGVTDTRWFNGMIAQIVLTILSDISRWFYSERKQYIIELKYMRVFPLSVYHSTEHAKKKIQLANLSPWLYCFIFHRVFRK